MHPDELTYLCDCPKCQENKQRQLDAYNAWYAEWDAKMKAGLEKNDGA